MRPRSHSALRCVTVHFGGDPGSPNYLSITAGWSYVVRMCQPRRPLVDGTWRLPEALPVE